MDWPALLRGALWVGGLAVALAAFSHMRWTAQLKGVSLRIAIGWDSFLAPFFAGLTLFAAGMAWGALALWEKVAWAAVGVAFAWQAATSARNTLRENPHGGNPRMRAQEKDGSHETH